MKIAILAGGRGSHLAEGTDVKSNAMLPFGDEPVLWGIMRHHAHFGFHDFLAAFGYQAGLVQRYFAENGEPRPDLSRTDEHRCHRKDGLDVDLIETTTPTLKTRPSPGWPWTARSWPIATNPSGNA